MKMPWNDYRQLTVRVREFYLFLLGIREPKKVENRCYTPKSFTRSPYHTVFADVLIASCWLLTKLNFNLNWNVQYANCFLCTAIDLKLKKSCFCDIHWTFYLRRFFLGNFMVLVTLAVLLVLQQRCIVIKIKLLQFFCFNCKYFFNFPVNLNVKLVNIEKQLFWLEA